MIEIRKTAVAFEAEELLELEVIVTDLDKDQALRFLRKSVYQKILFSQQGRLKSHLDSGADAVQKFKDRNKED